MLIEERRRYIVAQARKHGRVVVDELAESLGISRITVRGDLDHLETRGLLYRTYGGALLFGGDTLSDPSLQEKECLHCSEKERIAAAASELVQEGRCILLDSGTTTLAIARALRKFANLTIITNAVNIAAELNGTGFEVMLTGGSLRRNSFSLVGPLAEETLRDIHADILFLGVDGFDLEAGLTTPNLMEARVNRAMVEASSTVVVVCDSTKFERRSLSKIVDVGMVHHVITDKNLPQGTVETLDALNIKVTLV